MNVGHMFRTAMCERRSGDSFFNEVAPPQDPNDPNKLAQKPTPPPGGDPPNQGTQPPVATQQPQQNPPTPQTQQQPASGQQQGNTPAATSPPQTKQQPAPSQKSVTSMTVSSSNDDSEIANGIVLPKGTPAVISPGDLSGNVSVTFGGKTYTVPDANLKSLIKSGGIKVDKAESLSKNLIRVVEASDI